MIFQTLQSKKAILLSLIAALLFIIAWPSYGFAPFIFIAFVPLLWMVDNQSDKRFANILNLSFWTFLLWNIATTWWICKYNLIGGSSVIFLNSLCMAGVFTFYGFLKKRGVIGAHNFTAFISLWLSWEWIHQHWDLSWPWLNLGNVFASSPSIIQWYQFTGVFGGTAWVLLVNLLLYKIGLFVLKREFRRPFIVLTALVALVLVVPISYSLHHFHQNPISQSKIKVLIIQQNTNPASEQNPAHAAQVAHRIENLILKNIDSTVDLVVIPESAIINPICEDQIASDSMVILFKNIQRQFSNCSILIGATLYKPETTAIKQLKKHNVALFFDGSSEIKRYSKSKLVPGVEEYPFAFISTPLVKALEQTDFDPKFESKNTPTNFILEKKKIAFAPSICYESVYGAQIAAQVKQGAQFLAQITNDGWWDNTDGYNQHLAYARLRAIETQCAIVRAANTGISAIVLPNGVIAHRTQWNCATILKGEIPIGNKQTFYALNGDYILHIANFVSLFWIISLLYKTVLTKNKKTQP